MWKLLTAACLLAAVPAFGQEKVSAGESQPLDKSTCASFDLQLEIPKNAVITFANNPTNQDLARLVLALTGELYWDEVTQKGKKSPGICQDKNHPYYVMTWTDIRSSTVHTLPPSQTHTTVTGPTGETTTADSTTYQETDAPRSDHYVMVEIYVVDYARGCLVAPAVFGTGKYNHDSEKATKKAMEDALQFLLRTGRQPAPKELACFQPRTLGIDADYFPKPSTDDRR